MFAENADKGLKKKDATFQKTTADFFDKLYQTRPVLYSHVLNLFICVCTCVWMYLHLLYACSCRGLILALSIFLCSAPHLFSGLYFLSIL